MTSCDDLLSHVLFGVALDDAGRAHVETCVRCGRDAPVVRALAAGLATDPAPDPPAGLAAGVLAAAAPALRANARAATPPDWRRVARAIGVALVPLPLILLADVSVLRALHAGLSVLLPATLSGYLVLSYALTMTLLLAASYAAVPLLAGRLAPPRLEDVDA